MQLLTLKRGTLKPEEKALGSANNYTICIRQGRGEGPEEAEATQRQRAIFLRAYLGLVSDLILFGQGGGLECTFRKRISLTRC